MFASLNVLKELQKHYENNPKDPLKGIIWHTQGSGKTALTYHLTKLIRDFFSQSNLNKKTKFYFIVDRLDLLEQAKNEFSKRGLCVHEAENKKDLSQKLKNSSVFEGPQGNDEIIVVNIQKFKAPNEEKAPNEDPSSTTKEIVSKTELQESIQNSYDLQRVFIIDEAHRSYDPKGCFYANLIECDKTAVKIALTGTPLLEDNAQDKATKNTFGNYLHTYSYTESIKDRHTLTLQLETIEASYKEKLQTIYRLLQESITIEDIEVKKETIFNDEKYIKEMLSYIIRDLLHFRSLNDDEPLKAMVVCSSSKQARLADCLFNEVQEKVFQENPNLNILNKLKSSLILHDEQEVKEKIYSFKHEDTDIVFVFNMLLTGFDLPGLKRLYIHRELKDHNLLQALARVNRPYNNMSFGYLIDFVGIQENFDKTTDDYLKELNQFNQSDANSDSNLKDMFADRETLEKDIKNAYDDLFNYPIDDIEDMTSAIVNISAMNELLHTLAYKIYEYYFKYKPKNAKLEQIIIENPKSNIMVKNAQKTQDKYPFFTSGDNILSYPKAIIDGRNCFLNTGGNAGIKFYVGKASYSTDTWCICANEFSDHLYLLLSSIKTHINQSFFQGTSLKHLQKNLLKKYPIYMPSAHEIKKFNQIMMPLLTLISINTRTSKKLEQIRDFLLPLLLKQQVKPQ